MRNPPEDLEIYRHWLLSALSSYPDAAIAANTKPILDAYDVVDKMEYPEKERLLPGAVNGYDTVMLTGSSTFTIVHQANG